ncbi:MAG: CHC2 zinc finger domain-containing protein [Clostridiales bacterium]|nr:CHC2 zinc finger domain-containing protein [Clostridiales bacterium]
MNVFEAVRDSVTARQAVETYGIKVNRNGMALCPFHNDKNPSMKIYKRRYHCFGCQADGDAIDFTANYFGLSKKDAAIKLAEDFGIAFDNKKRQKSAPAIRRKTREQLLEQTEQQFFRIISDYYHLLRRWKAEYAPQPEDEDWHPLFVEALENLTVMEYLMDTLLYADTEEKVDLMNDYREKVKEYERRIREVTAAEAGRTGSDNRDVQFQ